MVDIKLNHPFFIYPRGFLSEYNDYKHYRNEVVRLNQFIEELTLDIMKNHSDKEILIPFIIGSSMEDSIYNSNTNKNNYFQISQLFPNYINNFIQSNDNNKFIQVVIISPDAIFSQQFNKKPYFISNVSFEFIQTNLNEYIYSNENITIKINIFNCPMPCLELRSEAIIRYDNMINFLDNNYYNINTYKQTTYDVEFIEIFYLNLNELFSLINRIHGIKIIINSWVSFKNLDGISNKYNMFPKILELANKYNIIATEWEFIDEQFFTKIISNYKFGNKNFIGCHIDYVFDELILPKHVVNMNFDLNNLFEIDFNSTYYLKKKLSC